jgi:hypothetical protein
MLLPVEEIEYRLRKAGVPEPQILFHVGRVTKWRKSHPKKIRRHRLYDNQPVSASGHTLTRVRR